MIWILGASGYIGEGLVAEAKRTKTDFRAISRKKLDYSSFKTFFAALKKEKPDFVINAAGFTGKPNVDVCEILKGETIRGNVILPLTVAQACDAAGVMLGTVSTGCIYAGAKVLQQDGSWAVTDCLTQPSISEMLKVRSEKVRGFSEKDEPNFTFGHRNCSFYSGTKAITEQALREFPDFHVWRIRMPFDKHDGPRNYLSKLQSYPLLYQNWNSLTHRGEFARACLTIAEGRIAGGVYNMTNPGYVSTGEVVAMIKEHLRPGWQPDFWAGDDDFYRFGASTPRSNCVLDTTKILKTGIQFRTVSEALDEALARWQAKKVSMQLP